MLAEWFTRIQTGTDVQKALFMLAAGVFGVFVVLAVFYGLIHLLRRVLPRRVAR